MIKSIERNLQFKKKERKRERGGRKTNAHVDSPIHRGCFDLSFQYSIANSTTAIPFIYKMVFGPTYTCTYISDISTAGYRRPISIIALWDICGNWYASAKSRLIRIHARSHGTSQIEIATCRWIYTVFSFRRDCSWFLLESLGGDRRLHEGKGDAW